MIKDSFLMAEILRKQYDSTFSMPRPDFNIDNLGDFFDLMVEEGGQEGGDEEGRGQEEDQETEQEEGRRSEGKKGDGFEKELNIENKQH